MAMTLAVQRQSSLPSSSSTMSASEMSSTTMELQPPWASELLARNRKVARNIWSTSDLSELEMSHNIDLERVIEVPSWTNNNSSTLHVSSGTSSASATATLRNVNGENVKNIDSVKRSTQKKGTGGGESIAETSQTDKPSMTHNNVAATNKLQGLKDVAVDKNINKVSKVKSKSFDEEEIHNEQEESLIEYGPGIVRKLRSKYQSLAVRQHSSRPSLWRSTSLENCLDLDQPLSPAPPSPMPVKEMTIAPEDDERTSRGRKVTSSNVNASDRMRRARSVDALHGIVTTGEKTRPSTRRLNQQQLNEEEILEKCKTVVTPKEEIVIIEMSKPSTISTTGAALLRLAGYDKRKLQQNGNANVNGTNNNTNSNGYYYRNSSTAKNYFTTTNSASFDSTGLVRGDSITSPVHELPPHDIVRETARLFEIHNCNSTSGTNNNWRKVVGQALRLQNYNHLKSPSPEPTTNSPLPLSPAISNPPESYSVEKPQEVVKGSSNISTTSTSAQVPTSLAKNNSGKQIGIIRPTVNGLKLQQDTNKNYSSSGNNSVTTKPAPSSPGLSPIVMNSSLSKGKPPLSPKPTNLFYTSSPKPLLGNNSKIGSIDSNNTIEKTAPKESSELIQNTKHKEFTQNNSRNDLQHKNQNGNDVMLPQSSIVEKQVSNSTSLKYEESESKSYFTNVTLKPVPFIITKDTKMNNSSQQERENKEPNSNDKGNMNTLRINNPSAIMTDTKGFSPSPRASPTREPLPFQQVKSQLKRQAPVNNNSLSHREEIISVNNGNSNNNNSSNNAINNANLIQSRNNKSSIISGDSEKKEIKTTTMQPTTKAKLEETETEKKPLKPRTITANNPPQFNVVSSSSNSSGTSTTSFQQPTRPTSAPIPVPQQQQQPTIAKPTQSRTTAQDSGAMVFNFTTRNKVPDYIEDDGLVALKRGHNEDEADSNDPTDQIDSKLIQFVGANIIINGKSSIQKKPKTQKLNISFNESATTTFEYPSETSILLSEDNNDSSEKNNSISTTTTSSTNSSNNGGIVGQKTPNGIHGSVGGLGNYTPSKASTGLYQLGSYKEKLVDSVQAKKSETNSTSSNTSESMQTENYLRPDTETTTWSNEIGAADILF